MGAAHCLGESTTYFWLIWTLMSDSDAILKCGIHSCPSKCHQLADHSKMECQRVIKWNCSRGHSLTTACFKNNGTCRFCTEEEERKEKQRQRNLRLDIARAEKQKKYERVLTSLQDEIEEERRRKNDEHEETERQRVINRTRAELIKLRSSDSPPPERNGSSTSSPTSPRSPNDTSSEGGTPVSGNNSPNEANKPKASPSPAQQDWDYQKKFERAQSDEIDTLMGMIGLENVKSEFLTIKAQVDTAIRQGVDLSNERFGTVLVGNPGTGRFDSIIHQYWFADFIGKTTVARIYAKFLSSIGVLPGDKFEETTGSRLANAGVSECETIVNKILNGGGGVLFIDEAYQLTEGGSYGAKVVDYLLGEVENLMGKLVIVLAGYRSNMEKFFGQNPGLPSRFPRELRFNDYSDDELREIFKYRVCKKYGPKMKIADGMDGLYSRIVARQVGRGRGKEGFANARAVEIAVSRISGRQANRLSKERRTRNGPVDDMQLTKEDLIGPEPSQALEDCSAWQKLQELIGLQSVKDTLRALLDSIEYNYARELEEKPLMDFTLNRVFLGSPGTGKTSVAKLYGQILVDIGLLSNGEVVVKNPADFIGSVLGESEKNTKGILAATVGKVLVIDEAYGLHCGGGAGGADLYKTAVVDTIVAEVQSTPGDDRCVLLLGYQDQMTEMFQSVNPGLQRRFPLDSAFMFEDFTDDELGLILDLKLRQQGFETTDLGRKVALEVVSRARNRPNFGNAGEIDILLNGAKIRHQQRLSAEKAHKKKKAQNGSQFQPQDFDKEYDRGERDETNIPMLFAGTVGCEKLIEQLEGYRQTVRNMRRLDIEPRDQIPFNFLFRGPPGTGKTTTARKMGKVYYDMGFLSSADVIESSATDLVGEYIGHTGPKTQKLLERALGKVLLIDEAYRLGEGQFAKEAIDQVVDCITKPKFNQKLIIILAGYDHDINRLMTINPGLTSRFPESIPFNSLSPDACVTLLATLLQLRMRKLKNLNTVDISVLETPTADFQQNLASRFSALSYISNWANARDVETLANAIFRKAVQAISGDSLVLSESITLQEMDGMVTERLHRQSAVQTNAAAPVELPIQTKSADSHSISTSKNTSQTLEDIKETKSTTETAPVSHDGDARDPGVSDDTWNQLQTDKSREEARESEYQRIREEEKKAREAAKAAREEEINAEKAALQQALDDEERRRHEQKRLRRELERRAREEELDRIQRQREEEDQRRKQEQAVQQKLQKMGVCCMGFRWIKQTPGYRCAGGTHFVSNSQL